LSIAGVAKEFFNVNGFTYFHGFGYDSVMNDYKENYEIDFRTPCWKIYTWMNFGRYIV